MKKMNLLVLGLAGLAYISPSFATGGMWAEPSIHEGVSDSSSFLGIAIVIAVAASLAFMAKYFFPNIFPTLGGILIVFVISQFIMGILVAFGANLHQSDSIWVFLLLLALLYVIPFAGKEHKNNHPTS